MPAIPGPDDDQAYLEQTLSRQQEAMRRLGAAQGEIEAVVGRAEDTGRMIRAAANGRGDIIEVDLDSRARRLDRAALGREVTAVLRAAQEDADRQTQEIVTSALADTEEMPPPLDESFVRDRVDQIARNLQ